MNVRPTPPGPVDIDVISSPVTLYAGVLSRARADLLAYLRECVPLDGRAYLLTVTLPCGEQRVYATEDDVPLVTVECECGRLAYRHFFVKYEHAQ